MTVKAVGHIFPVGNAFHNAVFGAELLYLKPAQALGRGSVNGVQVSVLLLEFRDFLVDMLKHLKGKLSVFHKGFAVIKLLKLIESRDAEAGRGSL